MTRKGEPKANNQARVLVHSVEVIGARGLRSLLSKTDIRLVNKLIRIFASAAADAQYVMNTRLLYDSRTKRKSRDKGVTRKSRVGTRRGSSKSKFLGVTYRSDNKKWAARVRVGNKRAYLGQYGTELKAHRAILKFNNKRRK